MFQKCHRNYLGYTYDQVHNRPFVGKGQPPAAKGIRLLHDYAIVANPAAGRMGQRRSRRRLKRMARRLDCPLLGLDSRSVDEFRACVTQVSLECRTLLIAGGDGSLAEAINSLAIDIPVGFLPYGSGNALDFALGRRCSSPDYLESIFKRRWIPVRVMICNGHRKSLMAGVGLDAETIHRHELMGSHRRNGLVGYGISFFSALANYRPGPIEVRTDRGAIRSERNLAAIVSKHPFFGYGLKISQGVNLADPALSLRLVEGGRATALTLLAAGLLTRRPVGGRIKTGTRFTIATEVDRWLQCDGELIESGREFTFELCQDRLRLIV